jgi:hypothetical protein
MFKSKKNNDGGSILSYLYRSSFFLAWAIFMPWTNEVTSFLFPDIGPLIQLGICILAFIGVMIFAGLIYEDGTNETLLVPLSAFCMAAFYITWKALPSWAYVIAPRNGVLAMYIIIWGVRFLERYHTKLLIGFRKLKFHLFSN